MSKKFYVPIEMTREYVRGNEIYEKIDGKLVRITPQMISEIVREGKLVEVHFVEVENEEVYREYMKQIWREGKAYERRNRCMVPMAKVSSFNVMVNAAVVNIRGKIYRSQLMPLMKPIAVHPRQKAHVKRLIFTLQQRVRKRGHGS